MKSGGAAKYHSGMPHIIYTYFVTYKDTAGAPSFAKFAKSIGATVADIESFRKHKRFEEAYRECCEIRRDYLIDSALTRRFDPSFVKFLLNEEFKMGDEEKDSASSLSVTLEVV
ncbi:MAG: hypothetical protein IJY65_05040 [Clostridia bacterium]|nr:hypothetical protein [Clostridia bacterium]